MGGENFNARAAKELPAGDWLIVPDAPGLRLVAAATRKTWTYRYRSPVDNAMRQVRLGHWPAMGLPAALAAWSKAKAARDAGTDAQAEKKQRRRQQQTQAAADGYTVRRMVDEYLAAYKPTVAPRTYAEAARLMSVEIDSIAALPAASLTRAHAFGLLEAMQTGASGERPRPVVARGVRQVLGAATDRALDAGRLPPDVPNWWRMVMRGKLPSKGKIIAGEHAGAPVKRALSEAELAALLPWFPNWSRDVEDALTLILWTGCRGAEVVAMESAEITEEADGFWWTIPRAKLKMRRNPLLTDLRVPLVGRALAVVRRRRDAAPSARWVFASRSRFGHIEQKALGVAVWAHRPDSKSHPEWVRPRLAISDWSPHDLRRTARTMLAALGCPGEVAEAILGHLLPGVQGTYNRHGYDAERRLWLTRLSDRLEQLAAQAQASSR